MKEVLKYLKNGEAACIDNIPPEALKAGGQTTTVDIVHTVYQPLFHGFPLVKLGRRGRGCLSMTSSTILMGTRGHPTGLEKGCADKTPHERKRQLPWEMALKGRTRTRYLLTTSFAVPGH